jgi:hypothetical protein
MELRVQPEHYNIDEVYSRIRVHLSGGRQTLRGLGSDIKWVWVVLVSGGSRTVGALLVGEMRSVRELPIVDRNWCKNFSRGFDQL